MSCILETASTAPSSEPPPKTPMASPGLLGPTVDILEAPILGTGVNVLQIGAGLLVAGLAFAVGKRLYKTIAGD